MWRGGDAQRAAGRLDEIKTVGKGNIAGKAIPSRRRFFGLFAAKTQWELW